MPVSNDRIEDSVALKLLENGSDGRFRLNVVHRKSKGWFWWARPDGYTAHLTYNDFDYVSGDGDTPLLAVSKAISLSYE